MREELEEKMNYLDLFSGIGGFRRGFEEAGYEFEWEGHSEIDKYAESVYQRHFPNSKPLGDIRAISPDRLPKIDLVTFGFPCQDLSVAGKRKGLDGTRSGLFYEAMRIIRAARPQTFIFENVKGLFSSDSGEDFVRVLREIADLGLYECEWQLLNTRWVLPQNRERIYFVGHLGRTGGQKVFPVREGDFIPFPENEIQWLSDGGGIAYCMDANFYKGTAQQARTMVQIGSLSESNSQGQRVYSPNGIACQLTAQGGGQGAKTGLYAVPVLTPDREKKRQNGRRFKENGDPMFTLTGQDLHGVVENRGIRRLTPIECERLQGFPDNWTQYGKDGEQISDTQRYKQLGNAVTVKIVKLVAERLK